MICRHYGRSCCIEYLEHFCHANVSGVSMLGITEDANHIGLNDMTVAASIIELNNITLPCILHWNQNHFVVLYKIKKAYHFEDERESLKRDKCPIWICNMCPILICGKCPPLTAETVTSEKSTNDPSRIKGSASS